MTMTDSEYKDMGYILRDGCLFVTFQNCVTGETWEAVDDHATGARQRRNREQVKVSLRQLAKMMGKSPTFVSHLERGMRHWSVELGRSYVACLALCEEDGWSEPWFPQPQPGE